VRQAPSSAIAKPSHSSALVPEHPTAAKRDPMDLVSTADEVLRRSSVRG
jgi:hypothetical protein